MTAQPLDELYFTWLYSQVGSVRLRQRSRTYWCLLRLLYTKEFVWFVPNDDNRVEEGRNLRYEFLEDIDTHPREAGPWLDLGCSMLEMLIGLSRRLAFETDSQPREWFWEMMDNVGLRKYNDANFHERHEDEIDEVLERIIWRQYEPTGQGGLFPLEHAQENQREVELWYQLNAYLIERD